MTRTGLISTGEKNWLNSARKSSRSYGLDNAKYSLLKLSIGVMKLFVSLSFKGRQLRLKEQYEQATQEGKDGKEFHVNDANVDPEKIKHIKDIFEMGGNEEKTSANKTSEHLVDPEKLKQLKGMFESGGENFGEKHERHEEVILGGNSHFIQRMQHLTVHLKFCF
jgi:hypothetical protein